MKTTFSRLFLVVLAALIAASPGALAQRQLGDKIYTARQATAFDAPGTIIETKEDSHNAFVYSNGTGMYIDQNTRVEIDRFVQEPFTPQRNVGVEAPSEPSISHSDVHIVRGAVGVCTSLLVSGSSMNYSTPQGAVTIRGGKVSIETNADETIVDLLEGDVTVRSGGKDVGGQILRPGERAVIRPGPAGQPPHVTISQIPPELLQAVDARVTIACNARKTVTFEVIEKKAEAGLDGASPAGEDAAQEIVSRPTVPAQLPTNVVVSPDRLPGS